MVWSFRITGVIAEHIYGHSPKDKIRQHVAGCLPAFPIGNYWYGGRRNTPGRPPKWIDKSVDESNGGNDQRDTRGQTASHGDQSAYEYNTNLDKDNVDILIIQMLMV